MSLKDWMKKVESAQLNEFATNGQVQIKPASQMPKTPGQQAPLGANNGTQPAANTPGQPATNANTQVITQGNKTLGTVNNPQLAQQIKQSIGKGEMTLAGDQLGEAEVMEVAPPGMEDAVLALKKKFPGQEGKAYAIAWSNYNKKNGKKDTKESMMAESKQLNEGTLEEIIGNHPHEHKMCQEGWGMDNSLYEALADHYFKEGRIPRSVWHGSAEELREFVESCYAKDTMGANEDMINGGMLDEEGMTEGMIDSVKSAFGMGNQAPTVTKKKPGDKIEYDPLKKRFYEEDMLDEVDMGQYDAVKLPLKGEPSKDWDKNFREKLALYTKELEQRQKEKLQDVAEGYDEEELANEIYAEFERIYPNLARRADERTVHAAIIDVLNYGGDNNPGALAQDVARAVKQQMQQGMLDEDGIISEQDYEGDKKYVIDIQTGEVIDGPFDSTGEIPLRLMGFDGAHKVVSGSELSGMNEGSKEDFTMNARKADPRLDKYATDPKPSFLDKAGKALGSALKKSGSTVMNKLHPSDEELRSGPLEETKEDEMFKSKKSIRESEERSYVCVHAKKGKCEVKASSSYGAAQAAAKKWGLKSTAGIDAYLADKTHTAVDEAVEKTGTGLRHTADVGGYGRRHEDDGKKPKAKSSDDKKGRDRPKKDAASDSKEYNFSAFGITKGKDIKLKPWDKKKKITHKLATKADGEEVDESKLKGKQSKLDINKNGKIDGSDFAMLRGKKNKVTESLRLQDIIDDSNYSYSRESGYTAKIFKDSDWGEYVVKYYKDGKVLPSDTWTHTDDIEDAHGTAMSEIKFMASKSKKDTQMESWDRQLLSMLNEDMEMAAPTVIPKQPAQQPAQQGGVAGGDIMGALKALLQNAGLKGGQSDAASAATPKPNAAGGDELDGSELQSGVDGPVNDKNSEPGSKDPRNNPISGQVFVPQLAMPRGMGMSVEGDVHTHEIDVQPQNPDEVQTTLAKDSDNAIVDGFKDLINRINGGNTRDGEAKLIVPYGDYAQEVGGETARDHQDVKQPNASVGVQGADDLDSIRHLAGTGGGILPSNLEESDMAGTFEEDDSTFGHAVQEGETFGHTTASPGAEQTAVQEDDEMVGTFEEDDSTFGHAVQEDETFGHETQMEDGGDKMNNGNQIDADLATSLMKKLEALLGNMTDDSETVDVEVDAEDDMGDKESMEVDTEDSEEKVEEASQPCNECGLAESKCGCPVTESKMFTKLLKMFGEKSDNGAEKLDEWANSPGGQSEDETFVAGKDFMTKDISGGLNGMKKDQTVLPNTRVDTKNESTEVESDGEMKQMKKLAGLK